MATAQRDEGLDKLEAFIALLDAAHDRLEEGAERLEAAAEELEEHEDDLEDVARAITRGGEGAMAVAMVVTTATAGVASDSESDEDPIVARVTALAELTAALEVYLKEVVIGEAAAQRQTQEKEELEHVAATLVLLQKMQSQLNQELLVLQERELDTTRAKEKALAAAECAKVPMIALAVVLTVIAIVVAVFTFGATLVLFAAVVFVIVACLAAVVQALVTIIENLPALLRAMGFVEGADALSGYIDQDWFKHACMVVLILASIVSLVGSLGTAVSVASMVLVLSAPVMIAMCVIENVARLLSALNPFD